ncbi:tetratricopeptide repeat protein [Streptomyces lavendofoliae]|uniref:tetratricopeptide repeat protein n=1 Tax=Streptomyces lavendofoliae TaxID=67314 RepID=UPI003D8EF844
MSQLLQQHQRAGFVGRQRELSLFTGNFAVPPEDPGHRFVFHVRGMAGVGKTTLVRRLEEAAREHGALTAYADETAHDVPAVMAAISGCLDRQGHPLKALDRRLAAYHRSRHEAELAALAAPEEGPPGAAAVPPGPPGGAPGAPAGPSAGSLAAAQAGLIGVGMLPVVGAFAGGVDPALVARGADRLRASLGPRSRSRAADDDARLALDPVPVLAPLLVAELNRVAGSVPWIALFLDTYERTGPVLDTWLPDLIAGERYGPLPGNTVLTLAGRDRLDPGRWARLSHAVRDLPLEPFTEPETRHLLTARGVVDEPVVQDVLRLSGGLPVLVSTLAQHPGEPNSAGATAVDRFLKWEDDPARRAAALACALPRRLNEDVFAVAVPDGEDPAELYGWLRTLPFVGERDDHAQYHDVVRVPMLRLQRTGSPQRWREAHTRLADAYAAWASAAGRGVSAYERWEHEDWRALRLEELYHRLCADPRTAVEDAVRDGIGACHEGPVEARRWARTLAEAGEDTGDAAVHRLGATCLAALDDPARSVVGVLDLLVAGARADDRAYALTSRGRALHDAGRYDEALADFDRAIGLGASARAYTGRALAHRARGDFDRALEDHDRAVESAASPVRPLAHRGETYRRTGRYAEALADLDRVVALDPAWVWPRASRAQVQHALGRPAEALADLDIALSLDPDHRWSRVRRAQVRRALGDVAGALRDLDHAQALAPADPWILGERGEALRAAGRHADAVAAYTRALDLDPGYAWALGSRALAHEALGDPAEALADLDRALAMDPRYAWAAEQRERIATAAALAGSNAEAGPNSEQNPT